MKLKNLNSGFIFLLSTLATLVYAQPANDLCSGAIPFPFSINAEGTCTSPYTNVIDLATATNGLGYDDPSCATGDHFGVWYTWEASVTSFFYKDNTGGGYLSIFEDGTCGSLNEIVCLNTGIVGGLTLGTQYYFYIWSTSQATISICIEENTPPANDICDDAIPFPFSISAPNACAGYPNVVDLTSASFDGLNCPGNANKYGVWYTWTASVNALNFFSQSFNGELSIYAGGSCNGLELIGCIRHEGVVSDLIIGNNYYIHIGSSLPSQTINFCIEEMIPASNDQCDDAIPLPFTLFPLGTCSGYPDTVYTSNSTYGETFNCNFSTYDYTYGLWYTWVATSEALAFKSFTTTVALFVFEDGPCGNLLEKNCVAGGGSMGEFTIGNTYILLFASTGFGSDIYFCLEEFTPAANNDCTGAIPYNNAFTMFAPGICSGTPNTIAINTATNNSSVSCYTDNQQGLWYSWNATSEGLRFFTGPHTVGLSVYEEGPCGALVEVDCINQINGEVLGLTIGNDYLFNLWDNYYWATSDFCMEEFVPAANDNCSGAVPYTSVFTMFPMDGCTTPNILDLSDASDDAGNDNPTCDGSSNYGVWYTWVATSEALRFEPGSGNPGIAIYEDGTCGALEPIGCLKSTGAIGDLTIGNSYIIFIWSDVAEATVAFCLEELTPLINDKCDDAIAFTSQYTMYEEDACVGFQNTLDLSLATLDINVSCGSGNKYGAWFTWLATTSGISFSPGSGQPKLAIFEQGSCDSIAVLNCGLPYTGLVVGNEYLFYIYTLNAPASVTFCLEEYNSPPNDICELAIPYPYPVLSEGECNGFPNILDLTHATFDDYPYQPSCITAYYNLGVWFTWTATSANLYFDSGSNNPGITIYDIGTCGTGTEYSPYGCLNGSSGSITGLTVGNDYLIYIWNESESGDGEIVDFCLAEQAEAENNNCSNALPLIIDNNAACGPNTVYDVSTELATDSGEGTPSCGSYTDDIFYEFTVPADVTSVTFEIQNLVSNNGVEGAIYSGTCGALVEEVCITATQWPFEYGGLQEGQTYYLRLWTKSYGYSTFDLCAHTIIVPDNDLCANATAISISADESCTNTQHGFTFFATADAESTCQANGLGVWYSFTPSATSVHNIMLTNTSTNLILELMTGVCGDFNTISCGTNQILIELIEGVAYSLLVSNQSPAGSEFDICVYPDSLSTMGEGFVGINTSTPFATLDVNGSIRIGNSIASIPGSIRWTGIYFEGFTGAAWTPFQANPFDEIQTITKAGSTVTLSNGGGSFVDDVDDADNDPTNEIETWSTLAGIPADFSDNIDHVNDADANPTNELQTISKSGSTVTLSNGGGSFIDEVVDADASPTNELQTISKSGSTVTLSNGGGSFIDAVNDADANSSNELQTISKAGFTVTLSNGGGSFIDAVDDADNSPTNEIETWSTLAGIPSGFSDNIDNVNDADADPSNELQTISKVGSIVTLSNSGGNFTDAVNDADSSLTNEAITSFSINSSNILSINEAGTIFNADISSLDNGWIKTGNNLNFSLGNVMIGSTAVPVQKLEIKNGGILIDRNSSSTLPQIELKETPAGDGARLIFSNGTETANRWTLFGLSDDTHDNSVFNIFYNGIGNVMTAIGNGYVGIRGIPNADFHLFHGGTGGVSGLKMENSSNGDWWRMYVSSGSSDIWLYSKSQGANIIGAFDDVSGAYTPLSDRRVKQNFSDLHFNWADFMQLKPLTYQFITDKDLKSNIGMVAQDVQDIYPELVKYTEEVDIYHMDYAGFGVIAIKAIQVLKGELEQKDFQLEAIMLKNLELEARLARLEALINE